MAGRGVFGSNRVSKFSVGPLLDLWQGDTVREPTRAQCDPRAEKGAP